MIDRQHGKPVWECDTCGTTREAATHDFKAEWELAKIEGWKATKVGEIWVHSCPGCEANA